MSAVYSHTLCVSGNELASVAEQLLAIFHTLSNIFASLSEADEDPTSAATLSDTKANGSEAGNGAGKGPWMLSPLLSPAALSRAVRSCLVTCAQALSTLHEAQATDVTQLLMGQGAAYDQLRGQLIDSLVRGVSALPILEVRQRMVYVE